MFFFVINHHFEWILYIIDLNEFFNKNQIFTIFNFMYDNNHILYFPFPTRMCTYTLIAPKSTNRALNMVFFFYALVLMLLSEFIPKRNIRRCSSCIFFFNYDAELAPNIMQICRIRIPASQVFFSDMQEIQIKDSFLYS